MAGLSQMADVSSTPTTYAAAAFTVVAGLTINEWVAIAGLILGVLTFGVNLYFKIKQHKLLRKQHEE